MLAESSSWRISRVHGRHGFLKGQGRIESSDFPPNWCGSDSWPSSWRAVVVAMTTDETVVKVTSGGGCTNGRNREQLVQWMKWSRAEDEDEGVCYVFLLSLWAHITFHSEIDSTFFITCDSFSSRHASVDAPIVSDKQRDQELSPRCLTYVKLLSYGLSTYMMHGHSGVWHV